MNVSRAELLAALQSVSPGLSTARETVEQSSCFVFQGAAVYTLNDEVFCRRALPGEIGFTGAVQAKQLLDLINKLPDDTLDISGKPGTGETHAEFVITGGKSRRGGVRAEQNIALPISAMERPTTWKPLPEGYGDAIEFAYQCAAKDGEAFALTCVHLHPNHIEAVDIFQMVRFPMATGVSRPTLVKRDTIKAIAQLGMTEFCETQNWLYYKNAAGLLMGLRRYIDNYPDLDAVVNNPTPGRAIKLPGGISDVLARTGIFSGENTEDNTVEVTLKQNGMAGEIRFRARSSNGWFEERKPVAYEGPAVSFYIAPTLLEGISKRSNDCVIKGDKLVVDGGKWVYIGSLKLGTESK